MIFHTLLFSIISLLVQPQDIVHGLITKRRFHNSIRDNKLATKAIKKHMYQANQILC